MNFALLFPLGLAALAAWALPLLIHLRRRDEPHRMAFAALRWLQGGATPSRQLRFTQWPLLLARLALLAAIALLLARPVVYGGAGPSQWTVVAPGMDPSTLDLPASEAHWLAPGFPAIEDAMPSARVPLGSLLRELDAQLPADTRLTVFIPATLDGADAEVPRLSRRVDWRMVSTTPSPLPATVPRGAPRPSLAIRHAAERTTGLRVLRATALAWRAAAPSRRTPTDANTDIADTRTGALDIGGLDAPLPPIERPLAWLSGGPPPGPLVDWVERGGTALVAHDALLPEADTMSPMWRDEAGAVLVRGRPQGRGRWLQWTRPVTPAAIPLVLDPVFPERVWQLFSPGSVQPARIDAARYRPLTGGRDHPHPPRDLQPWLLAAIATLFLLERWLATSRRSGAST